MKKPLYGDWNTTLRSECLQAEIEYMTETLGMEGSSHNLTPEEVQDIMKDRLER